MPFNPIVAQLDEAGQGNVEYTFGKADDMGIA
jgi:hypothetical protein